MKTKYNSPKRFADSQLAQFIIRPIFCMYRLNLSFLKADTENTFVEILDENENEYWQGYLTNWEWSIPAVIASIWKRDRSVKRIEIHFYTHFPKRKSSIKLKATINTTKTGVKCGICGKENVHYPIPRDRVMPYRIQRLIKKDLLEQYRLEMVELHRSKEI